MKIMIIGATGRIGSRIYNEAKERGHEVVGVSRSDAADISMNLYDLSEEDLIGFDALICSFSTWTDQSEHLKVTKHLDTLAESVGIRLFVVGGAGSLFVAEGLRLLDSDAFPKEHYNVADGMKKGLDYLQTEGQSEWTYFSPAAVIDAGERSGKYLLGKDTLLVNDEGNSFISMEDYAVAMMDVVERNDHIRERITAISL